MSPYRKETWDEQQVARYLFMGIVVAAALAMAVLFALLLSDRNNIKREANIRATQIQQQRYDVAYNSCLNQNERNSNTKATLNGLIAKLPPDQRQQAEQSKYFTLLMVNAIIPTQNCIVVAEQAVQPLPAPNNNGS